MFSGQSPSASAGHAGPRAGARALTKPVNTSAESTLGGGQALSSVAVGGPLAAWKCRSRADSGSQRLSLVAGRGPRQIHTPGSGIVGSWHSGRLTPAGTSQPRLALPADHHPATPSFPNLPKPT